MMPLGMKVGLGSGDFVFDRDPATARKKGTAIRTEFLAHVYCGHGSPSQLLLSSCCVCACVFLYLYAAFILLLYYCNMLRWTSHGGIDFSRFLLFS